MSGQTWFTALTEEVTRIVVHGGTEAPGTGALLDNKVAGSYQCARCKSTLYRSTQKFNSGCGWPSFDDSVEGAVQHLPDPDGRRVEIRCARCDGHLGHVFVGEGFTEKNTRHCVNSLSMTFVAAQRAEAYLGGGCFWGVEHYLQELDGVLDAESGYMGGHLDAPSYREICSGATGHAEIVKVTFDPALISFKAVAKRFFEIHDPTQVDRQGPDRGPQYRSVVFTQGAAQAADTLELVDQLTALGFSVATKIEPAQRYWPADPNHQDYYARTGAFPYCHTPVDRFSS
jgi:peptide methionine sulfoxide reductase msrA/msrB